MSTASLPPRRGSHRARPEILRIAIPSVIAVAVVAAIVAALLAWRGEDPPDTLEATGTATASATPSAKGSAAATPRRARTATPQAEETPDEEPTPEETGTEEAATRDTEVVVLNQTFRGGLAGRVGETLRAQGWSVVDVGNFRGNVPSTTVYYPPGEEAAAELLAADLPGPDRTRPAFSNISQTRLTVIVTDEYEES
jgi:hypothetical protein